MRLCGQAMTRLVALNRYFYPDHSATSQILGDLMVHLAGRGTEVHVVTSRQIYDDPARTLPAYEEADGVAIHRVATTRFGRSGMIGRAVDYLSFYWSASAMAARLLKRGDILLAMTDPPLCSLVAGPLALLRGAHLINWLQDIYPEIAQQLHVPFIKGPLGSLVARLRDWSLRMASLNVVVGNTMAARLTALGIAKDRIEVVPNWADDDMITPLPHVMNELRERWGLHDKFVVGYSGNLGRAHEFETIMGAAERLRDDPRIVFLFIGSGYQLGELKAQVHTKGHFRFLPYQPRQLLRQSLAVADVHWLSLRPSLEGLIVPSKFYGIAAAGRPIIAVTAADGEIARLVHEHNCGTVVTPGDADGLATAIAALAQDNARIASMGANARAMLEANFTRDMAFQRWRAVLARVEAASSVNAAKRAPTARKVV